MKKRTEKKLTLGKITIANLSKEQQQVLLGGMIPLTKTKCGLAPCVAPNTTNCTTHYVVCGC